MSKRGRLVSDILRFVIVGLVFFGLALAMRHALGTDARQGLEDLRLFLQGSGHSGGLWISSAVFVAIGAAAISVGVPRLWISGAAGAIYGALVGAVLALISSVIGALTVYCLGRWVLAGMVERRLGGRLAVWRQRFRENAFWWVLYARLFPFSNATLAGLLCGSCRVPFAAYLGASLLGFIPLTIVFAAFGSGGVKGDLKQVVLGFVLLAAAFAVRLVFKKFRPRRRAVA